MMKTSKQQVMKSIMRSILVHCNGYTYEDADKAALECVGHILYEEIEEVIDDIIEYGIKE